MAHGSKKWITDATGHYKKSHNRTKQDYYAKVNHWEEYTIHSKYNRWGITNEKHGDFCPQCKGIQKEYAKEYNQGKRRIELQQEQYDKTFAVALEAWHVYDRNAGKTYYDKACDRWVLINRILPKIARPPRFWQWKGTQDFVDSVIECRWNYHWRNALCPKHEHWEEQRSEMWACHINGAKEHYRTTVKLGRMYYRAAVKNLMQRAKHINDYEGYDAISPRVREWLD
jgi:hypothetical protein